MHRRNLLKAALTLPLLPIAMSKTFGSAWAGTSPANAVLARVRVRPGDAAWPSDAIWDGLKQQVGGRLLKLESPFASCALMPVSAACTEALAQLKNPYYIGDQPALTQTSGWVDAWTSQPSAYAVAATTTADVVAAVNFARDHNLRLVVKGGGHSYQGTSDAPDSLLVWTRAMNAVTVHDAFVASGCEGTAPQPAVTVGAGAMWIDAYDAVTTRGGRYVQGGGCTTVGVAGLVQSGGFGSFSKRYGTAAAGLIEAEVVTADGVVRIANARTNPDLFWGIKGGGGGSLGVVTRMTLRTRELPEMFGYAFGSIKAESDAAYRELIGKAIAFYAADLFNPHWGEQMVFKSKNILRISMSFQGLDQDAAQNLWQPFLDWVKSRKEYSFEKGVQILAIPAKVNWDADFFRKYAPYAIVEDKRANAPRDHIFWAGDQGQVGQFIHAYRSAWMPASLLKKHAQKRLADAVFAASRKWDFAFHFNKGLAGAPTEEIAAARNTATNPQVLDAFALAICAAEGSPAFPGMPDGKPDLTIAHWEAVGVNRSMDALLKVAPDAGSYMSESNYFEAHWQESFWGPNYRKLAAVKRKYDPEGLFFVHHGVGSETWSADGFARVGVS